MSSGVPPRARDRALRQASLLLQRAREAVWAYRIDRGRALLHLALGLLEEIVAPADTDVLSLRIRILVNLSYADAEAGSLDAGLSLLDSADGLLDGVPAGPVRDELSALILSDRGFLLIRAGRIDDGMQVLDGAAERLEDGLARGAGDPHLLATVYLNRSLAHIDLAQTGAAVAELTRCIELDDEYGLHPLGVKARHNLGYVAYMTGDMPTALRHYAEVERTLRARTPGLLPILQLDLARALLAAGLVEDAARHLDEALPQLRRQRASKDAAEAEITRAAAALLDGDVTQARRRARTAERMFTRRGNTRWAAVAALAALRADVVAALGRNRIPRRLPVDAVKLADRLRTLLLEDEAALALMLAIRMELRRGDAAAAAVLLDQVPRPRATSPVDNLMLLRLCRAELAVAAGNTRTALGEARAGLAELGRARDRMGGLDLVCGTAIHGRELGELAVRLVLERRRTSARQLFGWLERTRAQVYRYEPMPAIDDPVVAEKVDELRSLRRSVQRDRVAGRPARRQARQVASLEREILRQGWYATPWGQPKPVASFAEVAAELGDRALVTIATSGSSLVAVVVADNRARLVRLGSTGSAAEWAARLHADLNALAPDNLPGSLAAVVSRSAGSTAAELDTQLVRPLSRYLDRRTPADSAHALDSQLLRPLAPVTEGRELIVVPTGVLYAVPWGSLPSLARRPVTVAPSATAWLAAERAAHSGERVVLARGPLLTESIAEEGPLRTIYPDAVRLSGETATVSAVLSALDGSGVAHLAAHGAHEPTNALFSRLELADGPMFAHELSRLRQPPRQVVLAACELAMNHIRPGDEALGFAGALLAGGVRTVVAAASRVGDLAAATAMVEYHSQVAAGTRPAVALAEAVAADPFRRPFICLGAG
jgi:CHAT domain-containing protein/tetratricopeptide (TPR) repeat protein